MNVRKLLMVAALAVIPSIAMADARHMSVPDAPPTIVDTSGLTPDQVAAIQSQILAAKEATAKAAEDAKPTAVKVLEGTSTILTQIQEMGAAAAAGTVAYAKELGVAANEFVNTPMGRMVAVGTVIYFFGNRFLELVIGAILLVSAFSMARKIMRTTSSTQPCEWEMRTTLWGLWSSRVPTKFMHKEYDWDDGNKFGVMALSSVVAFALGVVGIIIIL